MATDRRRWDAQAENLSLRADLADAQFELAQLRHWKDDAVARMASWAPRRRKLETELAATRALQKRLRLVEAELQDRSTLSAQLADLREQDTELMARLLVLLRDNEHLKTSLAAEADAHTRTRSQLQRFEDQLGAHVERLVGVREALESAPPTDTTRDAVVAADETALIDQLFQLAAKNVSWLETYAAQAQCEVASEAQQQAAIAAEKETLLNDAAHHAARATDLATALATAEATVEALRRELAVKHETVALSRAHVVRSATTALEGKQLLDSLLQHVRQYLHLLQVEVKRKFGYVPESVAAPEIWARISHDLHAFDTFLSAFVQPPGACT
ncbi:hypothetical protein SPRG_15069 [Saprolegnia parasitica CBS 223.65]|uniref:Uncharacterized protein n=1 Tax=Saprolegnia parasitica (strain CBS 223.65) TaxID=695850 RepID=A0A067BMQ7_SAPPC|nr:hypothetical protein SPRG_15069 [Saprolegnia parasitica CBS 223.65]KDO19739.1 hypothetical protein SPRG_15069 [Saprolegnia parasitica CBS 223.65]|eukprot:XP_012209550.1 hypothetical protein SPRG_15069 [Saprolegnia parasitica CBS 223.65]